jgi:peptidoglycan/xylan/chitin deacetylase (PgdA/CDA1 family)
MTLLACNNFCQRFWTEEQLFDFEIDAELSARVHSPTRRDAYEKGSSPMTLEKNNGLPVCKIAREDPARPPLRRRIKHFGMKAAGQLASALRRLPVQTAKNDFGILIYHRVAPVVPGYAPPTLNVPPQLFREQIVGLLRQGFTFLSLGEVLRRRAENGAVPPRTVVVTFDDGFESVHEFAWPTLREFNVPATIFVNTAYLGQENPFPFDAWGHAYANDVPPVSFRPLTIAQCQEMVATGLVELGAHTHTHADFRGRPDVFREDMQVCLESLSETFQITSPTFAFPFGKPRLGFTDDALTEIVRNLGVRCALTTEATCAQLSDSPYSWGRFNVYEWDTADTLAAKALGFYSWVPLFERLAPLSKHTRGTLVKSRQYSERVSDGRSHASSTV